MIHEWQGTTTLTGSNVDLGSALATGDFNLDGDADLVIGDSHYYSIDPITHTWTIVGGAFLYFGCPSWTLNYGGGWPGKCCVPGIIALDPPVPGQSISVQIDNSLGAATLGVVLIGVEPLSIPKRNSGTILVNPAITLVLPIDASGETLTDDLPDEPEFYFLDIYVQVLELDAYASKGLSFTPGLQLHCGFDLR